MRPRGAPHGSRTHKASQGMRSTDLVGEIQDARPVVLHVKMAREQTEVKSWCGKPTAFGEFIPPFRRASSSQPQLGTFDLVTETYAGIL